MSEKKPKKPLRRVPKYTASRKGTGGVKPIFKQEYCGQLLAYMSQGKSLMGFAGSVGVSISVAYAWLTQYPEFKEAKRIGECLSRDFWDSLLVDKCVDGSPTHAGLVKSVYTNLFGWRDKLDVSTGDLSDEDLEEAAREHLE